MTNLNEFIDPDLTASDVLHSSGYASAASNSMGAGGGGMSLERRRELARRQRIVGDYAHSHLGRRHGVNAKARSVDQKTDRVYDASADSLGGRGKFSNRRPQGTIDTNNPNASVERRQRFIEPPSRGYNPFGS
jgi:hypothetical protein